MLGIKKLAERVEQLEKEVNWLKLKPIGMVYGYVTYYFARRFDPITPRSANGFYLWEYFYENDKGETHAGHIKIWGKWFPVQDVIFLDDIYASFKKEIEKRHEKQLKRRLKCSNRTLKRTQGIA